MSEVESQRQRIGRYGGLKSWANTVDRSARTRKARESGPSGLDWHLARLDPQRFAEASEDDRRMAAEAARKAYYADLAMKSAAARRARGAA